MKDRNADDPLDRRQNEAVLRLRRLSHLLDDRFAVPGTNWRFGFDGLLGLIPGIGDAATALLSAYIILEARRLGLPASGLRKMMVNLGVDLALGAIPLVGDLFDFTWKANRKNVRLVLDHLDRQTSAASRVATDARLRG